MADNRLPRPVTPGDVLRDNIVDKGITQEMLATAMKVSRFSVNQIINDRRNVTAEMALRLSRALGTTPEFWLQLQQDLDLFRAWERCSAEIRTLTPLVDPREEGPPVVPLETLFN